MARPPTIHVCSSCGHAEARWHGQCPGCGEWNTLVEERAPAAGAGRSGGAAAARRAGGGPAPAPVALRDVAPGIGTSTLPCLATGNLVGAGRRTLYVSGEESAAQIRLRHERLETP